MKKKVIELTPVLFVGPGAFVDSSTEWCKAGDSGVQVRPARGKTKTPRAGALPNPEDHAESREEGRECELLLHQAEGVAAWMQSTRWNGRRSREVVVCLVMSPAPSVAGWHGKGRGGSS